MADITRFNPFRGLARFDPLGRDMEDLFKGFFLTPMPLQQTGSGQIPIDVTEDEKTYKVRAEIPGFNREEISVSVNGDQVTISAETKKEREEKKGDQVVLRECYYGKQYRAFMLPQAVDDGRTSAKYANGVLELVLPKKEAGTSKKIAID
ncbi:Heat shock protein Hsp20 [Burkholderiales bacterium]|nr:Heat shock protein Hsp20 [Burkholderiales bacterium]